MKITDALIAEHGEFYSTFRFVEGVALNLETSNLQLMGSLLERLLGVHAEFEENFLFAALDHTLEEKGQRHRMHQVHQEIDGKFKEIQCAGNSAQARQILQEAIDASRKHFRYEEEIIFPLAEAVLTSETLEKLGTALFDRHRKG